jgi:hypothetical protein
MEARIVTRINIAARPPAVFKYLRHLKYHFLWNPHIRSLSPLKTLQEGMVYKSTSLMLGIRVQGKNQVTRLSNNRELQIENSTGTLKYRVNYKLAPARNGTLLTCSTTVYSDYQAFAFTTPIMKLLARRELQTDLQALKIAVEQGLA